MWILPRTLTQSNGSLATVETISDLEEQSAICASSLLVRSKPTPLPTWRRKWKRDSWTRHLSGRIAKPSPTNHSRIESAFLSLPILARDLAPLANASASPTPDTCGRGSGASTSEPDPNTVSLKTSPDTSRLDSPQSSAIWKKMATQLRLEYSARLKSAQLRFASGYSSSQNWNTPTAHPEAPNLGSNRKNGEKSLGAQATKLAQTWPTATVNGNANYKGCSPASGDGLETVTRRTAGLVSSSPTNANLATAAESLAVPPATPTTPTAPAPDPHRTTSTNTAKSAVSSMPGLWPSPAARDVKGANSAEHCLVTGGGQKHMDQLANYVVHAPVSKYWRAPTTGSPNSMRGSGQSGALRLAQGHTMNLQDQVTDFPHILPDPATLTHGEPSSKSLRRLNPLFVEWLMGIPIGWTDCDYVATASSPTAPKPPSAPSTPNSRQ